jgi:MinD superfamily P-loop ATPase
MVWSGDYNAAQRELAAGLAGLDAEAVLADYALGCPELEQLWGEGQTQMLEVRGWRALIDIRKCLRCGTCENCCPYNAIVNLTVRQSLCRGCGACAGVCAAEAISMHNELQIDCLITQQGGRVLVKASAFNNPDITTSMIKQTAEDKASEFKTPWVISSGPQKIDNTLFVTLPGLALTVLVIDSRCSQTFEFHRVISIIRQFHLPVVVVLYGDENETAVTARHFCHSQGIDLLGPVRPGADAFEMAELRQKLQILMAGHPL